MISLKWELDSVFPGDLRIWEDNGVKRCYKTPVAIIPQRSGHPTQSHPETDAIAALVLAAPSLLAACKSALEYLEANPDEYSDERAEACRNAIEAAEGREVTA